MYDSFYLRPPNDNRGQKICQTMEVRYPLIPTSWRSRSRELAPARTAINFGDDIINKLPVFHPTTALDMTDTGRAWAYSPTGCREGLY